MEQSLPVRGSCAGSAPNAPAECPDLPQALRALADPTRLRIFRLLMSGTHCNCELSEKLGLSLSLISHHLRALREVGLVDAVRGDIDARWVYYDINQAQLVKLLDELTRLLDPAQIQLRQPSCSRPARPSS